VFSEESTQELRPATKDAVRGWLHVGGWYLENLNDKEVRATLILELELKGSVPQFAIRGTNTIQGGQIKKIPAAID
jgi:hypothetical protein